MNASSDTRQVDKNLLAAEVLRSSGQVCLRLSGCSMVPAIWPGEIAQIERVDFRDIAAEDVVLVLQGSRFFVHRVIGVNEATLRMQGDSLAQADPLVFAKDLLGRVTAILRHGQWGALRKRDPLEKILAGIVRRSHFVLRVLLWMKAKQTRAEQEPAFATVEIISP